MLGPTETRETSPTPTLADAPAEPVSRGVIREEVRQLVASDALQDLCRVRGRYFIHDQWLTDEIAGKIKERVARLRPTDSLLLDFSGVLLSGNALYTVIGTLFYPSSYENEGTDRFVKDRHVVLAIPDEDARRDVAVILEMGHANCLILPSLDTDPREILYAGYIEDRLRSLLTNIPRSGEITSADLNAGLEKPTEATLSNFSGQLRELYHFGLLDRSGPVKVEGRRQKAYAYRLYHPYKAIDPAFEPGPPRFFRVTLPPRTNKKRKLRPSSEDEDAGEMALPFGGPERATGRTPLWPEDAGAARPGIVGRETEIREVLDWLADPDAPPLFITGPGGIGKTRLAQEIARRGSESFPGRVWFVRLADVAEGGEVLGALLDALGIERLTSLQSDAMVRLTGNGGRPFQLSLDDIGVGVQQAWEVDWDRAVRRLRRRPGLLILDNVDHLIPGALPLIGRLGAVPGLRILATVREEPEPGLPRRRALALDPLALPEADTPPVRALENPCVQLLVRSANSAGMGVEMTRDSSADIISLCRQSRGLPLAIELSGASLKGESASTVRGLLRASPRVMNLDAILLPAETARFFRQMAVFRGGWTQEAAEAVSGNVDSADLLDQLRERLFVEVEPDAAAPSSRRFRMKEALREATVAFWDARGNEDESVALSDRHARYFVCFVEAMEQRSAQPNGSPCARAVEREWMNLTSALNFCLGRARSAEPDAVRRDTFELAVRLTGALPWFYVQRGYFTEGLRHLSAVIELSGLPRFMPVRQAAPMAKVWAGAGYLCRVLRKYDIASEYYRKSLELYHAIGDRRGEGRIRQSLGVLHKGSEAERPEEAQDFRVARRWSEESKEIFVALGDPLGVAFAEGNLGEIDFLTGAEDSAFSRCSRAYAVLRHQGGDGSRSWILNVLSKIEQKRANWLAARTYAERAIAIDRLSGNEWDLTFGLQVLAQLELTLGHFARAAALNRECLAIAQKYDRGAEFLYLGIALAASLVNAGHPAEKTRAAMLLGAVARLYGADPSTPPLTREHQEVMAALKRRLEEDLGIDQYAWAWVDGERMTADQAIALALLPGPAGAFSAQPPIPNGGTAVRPAPIRN